mmetsp:Transcript_26345/g.39064  ORF Transcript_26345/g.39064 Transcript_26345/m.39064 type:complete len:82 (+) Transcript_26345:269-514(+)
MMHEYSIYAFRSPFLCMHVDTCHIDTEAAVKKSDSVDTLEATSVRSSVANKSTCVIVGLFSRGPPLFRPSGRRARIRNMSY